MEPFCAEFSYCDETLGREFGWTFRIRLYPSDRIIRFFGHNRCWTPKQGWYTVTPSGMINLWFSRDGSETNPNLMPMTSVTVDLRLRSWKFRGVDDKQRPITMTPIQAATLLLVQRDYVDEVTFSFSPPSLETFLLEISKI